MRNPSFALVLTALVLSGCRRDPEVRVTHEPKNVASASALRFLVPEGWESQPAGDTRQASFVAGPDRLDVSVTAFPGDVGGVLANVNRWRRQLNLPPVATEAEAGLVELVTDSGQRALTLVIEAPDQATLGAIISRPDRTRFVKLTGRREAVRAQRPAFEGFVHSLHVP